MSERKVVLVSKRFNPGHSAHLLASYKLFTEIGMKVVFDINSSFYSFSKFYSPKDGFSFFQLLRLNDSDIYFVWFPSVKALLYSIFLKIFSGTRILYVFHEPIDDFSEFSDAGFGFVELVKMKLVNYISLGLCICSSKVLLPSKKAMDTFSRIGNVSKSYYFPLLFSDESCGLPDVSRDYFSYIGTIAPDHAFDKYIDFILFVLGSDNDSKLKFLIATKSHIPQHLLAKLAPFLPSGRLTIYQGAPLSDNLINTLFSRSFLVWNAYCRSTQSGVMAKSYMFGTPILINKLCQNEFFIDGLNGLALDIDYSNQDIFDSLNNIMENFDYISSHCRESYLEKFDYTSRLISIKNVLN